MSPSIYSAGIMRFFHFAVHPVGIQATQHEDCSAFASFLSHLQEVGAWREFYYELERICAEQRVQIIQESCNPSPQGKRCGDDELKQWLIRHLPHDIESR